MQRHEEARQQLPVKSQLYHEDLNNSEEKETSNIDFKKIVVSMINELKEETQKLVSDIKQDMNKELQNLKETSNR
jgi:F0F1-type ATP synthase membrane subunit b/b'